MNAVKYALYLTRKKDTLHYVSVILNDITDNVQTGNIERAIALYDEAKVAYAELPHMAKNDIYEHILAAANSIESYQDSMLRNDDLKMMRSLIIGAENRLGQNQVVNAIEEYKKVEAAYHALDNKSKEIVQPQVVDLGNKIQVLIASNMKQSME
jgi:hypothetical protein